MLAFNRKLHEQIRINDDIVITIVDIRRDKVRVSIDAPRNVEVHRQEVYESIQRDGRRNLPASG